MNIFRESILIFIYVKSHVLYEANPRKQVKVDWKEDLSIYLADVFQSRIVIKNTIYRLFL